MQNYCKLMLVKKYTIICLYMYPFPLSFFAIFAVLACRDEFLMGSRAPVYQGF